ncbi:MAG: hypothetical protein ACI8WB_004746 [Phenylobacterium sp.]|jgi:hypothetical protein
MSFDITNAIGQMAGAIGQMAGAIGQMAGAMGQMAGAMGHSITDGADDIRAFAQQALLNQQDALVELAQARLDGSLDQQEFEQELTREMLIVETEMLAVTVIGKAALQKAIQAAMGVLFKLVIPG